MSPEEKIEKVQKTLGSPVFIYFSDETLKIRRNLIATSFVAIAYKLSALEIKEFSPLGLKFENPDFTLIDKGFFFFLIYCFIHFLWQSIDALQEWRIRLTGTKLAYKTGTGWSDAEGDYPDDPRQSSLLTWWAATGNRIKNVAARLENIEEHTNELLRLAKEKDMGELPNVGNIMKTGAELRESLSKLSGQIKEAEQAISSQRIPESLHRFEKWYRLFSYSQLLRFIVLEWGFPMLIALWALYLVFPWKNLIVALCSNFFFGISS